MLGRLAAELLRRQPAVFAELTNGNLPIIQPQQASLHSLQTISQSHLEPTSQPHLVQLLDPDQQPNPHLQPDTVQQHNTFAQPDPDSLIHSMTLNPQQEEFQIGVIVANVK